MAWNMIFLYGIETALEVRSLSAYCQKLLKYYNFKVEWLFKTEFLGQELNIFCILILIISVFTQNMGTSKAGMCNKFINILKIGLIIVVILVSILKFDEKYLSPFTIETK